uniref:Tick transposon n=1 Tax=Rhipicephalus zambeziensis TaxID=60191 RepID=A0A224Z5T7_9ACAR
MASPIPPPLFLSSPGDPPIPWADWKLMFQVYADAAGEDAAKPERRKALLLNALGYAGLKLYQTLSSANASGTPASADVFKAAVALFDDHFKDASCDYVARLRFQERRQLPGEPVVDFIASLRSLAASCGFGALENDMIRQQLFIGVASQNVRCRLLQKGSTVTLAEALSIAREDELVRVQLEQFAPHAVQQLSTTGPHGAHSFRGSRQHGGPSSSSRREGQDGCPSSQLLRGGQHGRPPSQSFRGAQYGRPSASRGRGSRQNGASAPSTSAFQSQQRASSSFEHFSAQSPAFCFRCGSVRHLANFAQCPARNRTCLACGKRGHYQAVCNSASRQDAADSPTSCNGQTNTVTVLNVADCHTTSEPTILPQRCASNPAALSAPPSSAEIMPILPGHTSTSSTATIPAQTESVLTCAAPVRVPAGRAPDAPAPAVLPAVEHTMVLPASNGSTSVARMAVPVGSAPADHASPACVSAVHTSVLPASSVLPAAAPAPAVLPPTVDALRQIRTVLRPPEEHPPTVPAVCPESVPVLCAAEVLPPVASAPTVLVPVRCTVSASVAPSHSPSEPHHYQLVPAPTVPKVHWKESSWADPLAPPDCCGRRQFRRLLWKWHRYRRRRRTLKHDSDYADILSRGRG